MIRPMHAVLAFAMIASTAAAQRGGGRGGDRFGGSGNNDLKNALSENTIGMKLTVGDVEDMSPVNLLVDKRKDLKLTDDQLKQFKAMNEKLKETNKPHLKALDSLRTAMRPRGGGGDPEVERARLMMTRDEVNGVLKTIRGNYQTALDEALPVLDATQRPKADELLKRQATETEQTLREKMGGGRGRG